MEFIRNFPLFTIVLSLFSLRFSTIFYILISGVLGLLLFGIRHCGKEKKQV